MFREGVLRSVVSLASPRSVSASLLQPETEGIKEPPVGTLSTHTFKKKCPQLSAGQTSIAASQHEHTLHWHCLAKRWRQKRLSHFFALCWKSSSVQQEWVQNEKKTEFSSEWQINTRSFVGTLIKFKLASFWLFCLPSLSAVAQEEAETREQTERRWCQTKKDTPRKLCLLGRKAGKKLVCVDKVKAHSCAGRLVCLKTGGGSGIQGEKPGSSGCRNRSRVSVRLPSLVLVTELVLAGCLFRDGL